MGLIWHAQSETILVPRERLVVVGWPVYPVLAQAAGIPAIEFSDLARADKYAGNAYHVGMVGSWIMSCLGCLRFE